MSDRVITRRQVLATGGAASLLLLAPDILRAAPALAAGSAISVGFVGTLAPLVTGQRVKPGSQVTTDSSLTNRLLEITVGGLHPATDAAFPRASLDAVFGDGANTYPFYAVTHPGGLATNRATFVQVPGANGLRFTLRTPARTLSGAIGAGLPTGLRAGTYLFGFGLNTWASSRILANDTTQRSLTVVIRPA